MRIALFHTTLPHPGRKLGGVEVAVHRLAMELARNPDDVVTVYSTDPAPEGAAYEHRRLGRHARWAASTTLSRLTFIPLLLNTVDLTGHDVLHLHGDDWFYFRRPIVTLRTMHGSALREAQTASSRQRKILQYAVFPLERLASRLADMTLAVGPDAAALYRAAHIVGNGVDLDQFRPGVKASSPTILFVGTLQGRKRGQLLQKAFEAVIRPTRPDAELIMVTEEGEPAPNVRYVPHPSDADLAALYRQAWVFAYPSRYEGFGIPYVEAMASGTAILTSANDGAGHVLANGRYGVVSDDHDFGTNLLKLLDDRDLRETLERAGLERANSFSWAAVARQHRSLYDQVLRERAQ